MLTYLMQCVFLKNSAPALPAEICILLHKRTYKKPKQKCVVHKYVSEYTTWRLILHCMQLLTFCLCTQHTYTHTCIWTCACWHFSLKTILPHINLCSQPWTPVNVRMQIFNVIRFYFRPKRCQASWQEAGKDSVRASVCVCAYSNACVIRYGLQAILFAKSLKMFLFEFCSAFTRIYDAVLVVAVAILLLLFGLFVCTSILYSYDLSCLLMGIMLFVVVFVFFPFFISAVASISANPSKSECYKRVLSCIYSYWQLH